MSHILITGASGLLGSYLLKSANPNDTIYSKRFDILDKDAVYSAFDEAKPKVVIHCAGEGRVDFAETDRCKAWENTYEGTEQMLRASRYWGAHFVYISSNAVYDGNCPPYNEFSSRLPINEYGRYKEACEELIRFYPFKSTIVRPILLYGWPQPGQRDNMATRLIKEANTQDIGGSFAVPVDNETISQPTYALDCAEAIWKIISMQSKDKDEFNVAAEEKVSLFKFAAQVVKAFDLNPSMITPVSPSEIRVVAKRPRNTTFALGKIHRMGIILRNQEEGLQAMKEEKR